MTTAHICAFENSTVDQTMCNIARLLQSRYGWNQDVIDRSVKRTGFIRLIKDAIKGSILH